MKRVMWLCNTPLPQIQEELRVKVGGEGWLQGISEQLRRREDIELHYAFPQGRYRKLFRKQVNHINFWGFYSKGGRGYENSQSRKKRIAKVIQEVSPDIIHIFGTEFAHSLECVQCVPDRIKVVVSIQGLISELAKVYTKKIPIKECLYLADQSASLMQENYEFYRRGKNEREILKRVKNVIGRTAWDKRCVKKMNVNCNYYYCSETLREPFYDGEWNINKIKKYSIYISQANYPIKGFHVFLKALAVIVQSFPDVHVYVAGSRSFLETGEPYGRYINKMMDKYGIRNKIEFLGILSAQEVRQRLLNVHMTVMPSLLENSPNSIGEAMLLGTPVIAAQVGGIPSLVRDGKEALLYSHHDAEKLADCIKRIFSDDGLAERLSGHARHRAGKLYDRNDNLEQLIYIYETISRRTDV